MNLGATLTPEEQINLASMPVVSGANGPRPKLANRPNTGKQVLNLASYNFTSDETRKGTRWQRNHQNARDGDPPEIWCRKPWTCWILWYHWYVSLLSNPCRRDLFCFADVHMDLERDIADFLGTESSTLYSQGLSTIPCVIPAFTKRGDIIVADWGINFVIQKGLQISRCTVRWFDHNVLKSLEEVLLSVEKERRKRRGPLTRRFIVTEGIF
jgi:serine palmitoyltransferase